jgi:hypothetical protein
MMCVPRSALRSRAKRRPMRGRAPAMAAVVLAQAMLTAHAAPCSADIDRVQAELNARIEATSATARFAREARNAFGLPPRSSSGPPSVGMPEPESRLGKAVALMALPREADGKNDETACAQALEEVQQLISR